MFKNLRKNWKTSSLGLGGIVIGIGQILSGNKGEGVNAILLGIIGLFAKDSTSTGA